MKNCRDQLSFRSFRRWHWLFQIFCLYEVKTIGLVCTAKRPTRHCILAVLCNTQWPSTQTVAASSVSSTHFKDAWRSNKQIARSIPPLTNRIATSGTRVIQWKKGHINIALSEYILSLGNLNCRLNSQSQETLTWLKKRFNIPSD